MPKLRFLPLLAGVLFAIAALAQGKYNGPRPAKPDTLYLLHASNLVPTEDTKAKEEKRKNDIANIVDGASSPARTPLAEPMFLIEARQIQPEKLELYKMDVKNGKREIVMPDDPKKRNKSGNRPVQLSVNRIEGGLYKLEADEQLENGEYCISPQGSDQVFCFQIY